MICPILSQPRRGEDGSVAWEHHECLREGCTFWAAEPQDCALRASGLAILRREAARAGEAPTPDPATLLSGPLARLGQLESKMEMLAERGSAATRDLGIRLLEGVAALEQPVGALRDEVESIRARFQEMSGVLKEALGVIERQRRSEEERHERERRDEARACNARGVALFHKGMHEAAEAAFRRAVECDPTIAEAHNNLGLSLSRMGRAEEAAAAFEKSIEIKPDLAGALNNMGFLCHEGMAFEQAAEWFRRAALAGSESSVAYTNLGNALYRMNRHTQAVDAWKRALEADPLNEGAARALRMFEGAEAP